MCSPDAPYLSLSDSTPIMQSIDPSTVNSESQGKLSGGDGVCAGHSFLLLDGRDHLKVANAKALCDRLTCKDSAKVKVVCIVGKAGVGKSHTLNQIFFNGETVFRTCGSQESCTLGVWAAYCPSQSVVCLDTEGMLSVDINENQRTRLLLKVLAVSDVVIYRTREERLLSSMYKFLGGASKAYSDRFRSELQSVSEKLNLNASTTSLGPAVVIFHETCHTMPLSDSEHESPENYIRQKFATLGESLDSFSSVKYVGIQTKDAKTDFSPLQKSVEDVLNDISVRSFRPAEFIYHNLKVLNDKFSGKIETPCISFSDQYFTCNSKCLCCNASCTLCISHLEKHSSSKLCRYEHQYDNSVSVCKKCHMGGLIQVLTRRSLSSLNSAILSLASPTLAGYALDCPVCGEIYNSRKYWWGNSDPEECTRKEVHHVWPNERIPAQEAQNSAQRIVNGMSYVTAAIGNVGASPARMVSDYLSSKVAPTYWIPNAEIHECCACGKAFGDNPKHHCRDCGKGVCAKCSLKKKKVPERGWNDPVRVCDICYDKGSHDNDAPTAEQNDDDLDPIKLSKVQSDVQLRQYSETVTETVSSLALVLNYPKEYLKDTARPTYWVPDKDITNCAVCDKSFAEPLAPPIHHCRDCGNGVCDSCSASRIPVPRRGWPEPSRVCDKCVHASS